MYKKIIVVLGICVIGLFVLSIYHYVSFNDQRLHLVLCDVGQGDAIFLRTPSNKTILIDGGPDEKVLTCLLRHLPFWQRTIDLMVLTHPHNDHFIGLIEVLNRFTVKRFVTEDLSNNTASFEYLMTLLKKKQINTQYVVKGDIFKISDGVELHIVGPSTNYLYQTSPNKLIGEKKEFVSVLLYVKYMQFTSLLTGDSQLEELQEARDDIDPIDVLQLPHHGSKTGINRELLLSFSPKLGIISVGRKNRYNHPSPIVLSLLNNENIPILRTDQDGEVEVESDGRTFKVKSKFKDPFKDSQGSSRDLTPRGKQNAK